MLWTFFLLPALLVLIEAAPFDQFFPGGPGRNILDDDYFFGNAPPALPFPDSPRGPRTPQRPRPPFGDDRRRWQQQQFPGMFPPGDDADDVFVFDRPTTPRPQQIQSTSRRTTTSRSTSRRTTTSSDATTAGPASTIANCNCPSTPEFNPVCGTDATTYTNPGKLQCAITCGADVSLKHYGSCIPTTTAPPQTTTRTTRRTTRRN